jgi:hypothetical protein
MSEFEEITQGYSLKDFEVELEFQCGKLGFARTDPFPRYLVWKISLLKS